MTQERDHLQGFVDASTELEHHVRARANALPPLDTTSPGHGDRVRDLVSAGINAPLDAPRPATRLALHTEDTLVGGVVVGRGSLLIDGRPPVPALLYTPPSTAAPAPGVLFLSGHAPGGKDEPSFVDVCTDLAQGGCFVLAPDPWAQGDRVPPIGGWGVEAHTREGLRRWWGDQWLVADMLLEYRCALDALAALPLVDPSRLGATGTSGGGWMTTLLTTVDARIGAAAIATFVTSRASYRTFGQAQDAEQHLIGAGPLDHGDFLAAMAPRPVAVLAATWDFFPIEGTFDSYARARLAYDKTGSAELLSLRTADCGHGYTPPLRNEAVEFFTRAFHLPPPGAATRDPVPGPPHVAAPSLEAHRLPTIDYLSMRPRGSDWLQSKVLQGRSRPEHTAARWLRGEDTECGIFWRSETDLSCGGIVYDRQSWPDQPQPAQLTLVVSPQGTSDRDDPELKAFLAPVPHPAGPTIHLDLRGQGLFRPRSGAATPGADEGGIAGDPTYRLLSELLWLGDSLMAGRVHDLLRAVDILLSDNTVTAAWDLAPTVRVLTVGDGPALCAELAALLDPRVLPTRLDGPTRDIRECLTQEPDDWTTRWWEWVLPGWLTSPA